MYFIECQVTYNMWKAGSHTDAHLVVWIEHFNVCWSILPPAGLCRTVCSGREDCLHVIEYGRMASSHVEDYGGTEPDQNAFLNKNNILFLVLSIIHGVNC